MSYSNLCFILLWTVFIRIARQIKKEARREEKIIKISQRHIQKSEIKFSKNFFIAPSCENQSLKIRKNNTIFRNDYVSVPVVILKEREKFFTLFA